MDKQLLLGDEAIAQAALDAGLSGVYAYPGTPSTEITEYIQAVLKNTDSNIHRNWCANEKTAMEAALGMSFVGKRALVCMKHVGMNVAADCFINAGVTGVNGGVIVVAADDPSMHSSQNEQDSRFYGDFSLVPMLEPSNQQEAYDMVYSGFELSEKTGEPILLRIVTRLAHSRAGVERKAARAQNEISFSKDPRQFILLPGNARKRYKALLALQSELIAASENSIYNTLTDGPNKKLGIVACGIAYNYLMENYPDGCEHPVLKIGQYPLPKKQLAQLAESCDEILVLEDGQPFVERQLKGYLGDVINGALLGDLFEAQWHALAGQVFDRAGDLRHLRLAVLDHRNIDHALSLAANEFGRLGDVRRQVRGVEGVVVHRHVAKGFLAFALDDISSHGRDAQAGGE